MLQPVAATGLEWLVKNIISQGRKKAQVGSYEFEVFPEISDQSNDRVCQTAGSRAAKEYDRDTKHSPNCLAREVNLQIEELILIRNEIAEIVLYLDCKSYEFVVLTDALVVLNAKLFAHHANVRLLEDCWKADVAPA